MRSWSGTGDGHLIRGMVAAAVMAGTLAAAPAHAQAPTRAPEVYIVGDSVTAGRAGHHGTGIGAALKQVLPGSRSLGHAGRCLALTDCHYQTPVVADFRSRVLSASPRPDVVVVEAGINDLAHLTDHQFKLAYRELVQWGAARGITVLVSTITPTSDRWPWAAAMEPQRLRVNAWLRTRPWSVDLAALLESHEGRLRPLYDCGDGLHPNIRGSWLLARSLAATLADIRT